MNTPVIYINPQSSIAIELTFYDSTFNQLDPVTTPFKYVYLDRKKTRYEVEYQLATDTQSEYFKNCYLYDGRLFISFENTGFVTGRLERECWIKKEFKPDKGEGFSDNEMQKIITETSAIEIINDNKESDCMNIHQYQKNYMIGIESIIFPAVKYRGVNAEQSEILINDFINNKAKIAEAINDKGGKASASDSTDELARQIEQLVPATPKFKTSGNLNPKWTDLQNKIAENYRENRKHCWAFSFLGEAQRIELTGGDYYICSDGYETSRSETHTFGRNLDESKTDNWVIIYTQIPTFVFPSDLSVIGTAFYNTNPEQVIFKGTRTAFISQIGGNGNTTMNVPEYFAQNTAISYFTVPTGIEDLTIGDYAFDGCNNLMDIKFNTVRNLLIGQYSFRNIKFYDLKIFAELSLSQPAGNAYFLGNLSGNTLTVETESLVITREHAFSNVTLKKLNIKASKILALHSYRNFYYSNINELFIENPADNFSFSSNQTFQGSTISAVSLGDGWNWPIILTDALQQNTASMYQNVKALADRTVQTALTLTFGATKLAMLLAAYPDAAEIASSKNWNLA